MNFNTMFGTMLVIIFILSLGTIDRVVTLEKELVKTQAELKTLREQTIAADLWLLDNIKTMRRTY